MKKLSVAAMTVASEGLTSCPHPFRKDLCWRYKDRALYGSDVPETTRNILHNPRYRIPLWELVYHDCTVSYYYWADSTLMYPELTKTKDLFCALYGLPPIYSMTEASSRLMTIDSNDGCNQEIRLTLAVAGRTLRRELVLPDRPRPVRRHAHSDAGGDRLERRSGGRLSFVRLPAFLRDGLPGTQDRRRDPG